MSQLKYYNGSSWVPAVVGAQGVVGPAGVQGIQGPQGIGLNGWATIATGTVTSGNTITVSSIPAIYANGDFEFFATGITTAASAGWYLTINGDTGNNYALVYTNVASLSAPSANLVSGSNINGTYQVVKISGPSDGPKVFVGTVASGTIRSFVYVGTGAVTSLTLTLTASTFTGGTWYLRARP